MLNIKKNQSVNFVRVVGLLNEIEIDEKITNDGRGYVQGRATIRVDKEVGGKLEENLVPIRMFAMRKKKDGTDNSIYDGIVKMKEDFISVGAAENESQASRVVISSGQFQESIWIDKTTGQPRSNFQISSNFMRKATNEDEDTAEFELSGVVLSTVMEEDKNGEETGRLKVKFALINYKGEVEIIDLIAENPVAVEHIQSHWAEGDTVSLTGIVNMTYKKIEWEEEQGFGAPIKRHRTESKRELIITGGSPSGFDEDLAYDADEIRLALANRKEEISKLQDKQNIPKKITKSKANDFGF